MGRHDRGRSRVCPEGKPLAQGQFTCPEPVGSGRGSPRKAEPFEGRVKKMRSLGRVPIPTEAFMAVWKLDEE